jgi:hypothetical protein
MHKLFIEVMPPWECGDKDCCAHCIFITGMDSDVAPFSQNLFHRMTSEYLIPNMGTSARVDPANCNTGFYFSVYCHFKTGQVNFDEILHIDNMHKNYVMALVFSIQAILCYVIQNSTTDEEFL